MDSSSAARLAVPPGAGQAGAGRARWLASRVGGGLARVMKALLAAALGLMVLASVGAASLGWRLSQGPLELDWLARGIESAVNRSDGPTRLGIGQATLAWDGFRGGAGQPVELRLAGIRAADPAGGVLAELARAEVSLSASGLLAGEIVPRAMTLDGARLRMLRAADGKTQLDLGSLSQGGTSVETTPLPQLLAELGGSGGDLEVGGVHLRELRRVLVRDLRLDVVDQQLGATWRVSGAELDLQRPEGGSLSGTANGALALGDVTGQLQARAVLAPDGTTRVEAALSPVSPAALARQAAPLAALAAVDAAVELAGTLDLAPTLAPLRATLRLSVGEGSVRVAPALVAVQSASADIEASWNGPVLREFQWKRVQAVLPSPGGGWPTTLQASGGARLGDELARIDAAFDFDHMAFANLSKLWPEQLARNARKWLVENLTAGTARGGKVALSLEGRADLSNVNVVAATGEMQGDDVTIHWLRPIPPVEHVQAMMHIISPDVIEVATKGGRQGAIQVPEGNVRISGLATGNEAAAITIDVAGGVADTLALLRHPRLKLLDRQKIELRNPGGSIAGRVAIGFPLIADLDADQLDVHATARTTGLRLAGIAAGRDLERGAMQLDVTQDGLKATGSATVGGIPGQLAVELDFRSGPPSEVIVKVAATGRATAQQLGTAGLDVSWIMDRGQVALDGTYSMRRDDKQELRVRMDLRAATLSGLGWSKAAGVAGQASARLAIQGDRLVSIEELKAEAPGLSVLGRSDVADGQPSLLLLDRIVLGRTRAAGEVRLPARRGGAVRATVSGEVLDLSAQLARKTDSARVDSPGTPWTADVVFDRVLLGGDRALVNVAGNAESDGKRIRSAKVETGGREQVRASIVPRAGGRQVMVRAADAGSLLRAFDVTDTVAGGRLSLDARYDDGRAEPSLAGTVEVTGFGIREAELIGKVLQAVTLYGLVDALRGPGLVFDRLVAPFRLSGDVLELRDARAFSSSLGVTAKGRLDTVRRVMDIEGTIVPAYVINSALGRLPLVGRLFSPEQGGGVLSVTYAVRGKLDDPTIVVNPLSALTPGVLRRLFDIFD